MSATYSYNANDKAGSDSKPVDNKAGDLTTAGAQKDSEANKGMNLTSAPVPLDDFEANDPELAQLKKQMMEMEQEAAKLRELQAQTTKAITEEHAKEDVDARSVYVGNVDYSSTPEELQAHFQSCGAINRVTILCDKYTGHPKGFAYVEFADKSSIQSALQFEGSLLHGRAIKVIQKRTNVPGYSGRGRGGRGGGPGYHFGGGRGGGYYAPRGGRPYGRGRGRGRGAYFAPY
ncbi:Polyadenylate-binding protein 2 [Zancudomyces culisetae]|uniref:Polyadenylate-binding protein 2 n=1 Tax=Zancudomyces culisetae TaxID=1213189 RepID=A0A1R1PJX7_ZANCU|nr:Polyadenylate-binding protein 2 [Zancudomyces culisetae]|eukprot:OMH81239.1 Polyadenylate-binding protein 2 [Zancudomyces culisetae]